MRARMAIWVSQTPVELREVVLRNKPEDMVSASPKATVPVLVDTTGFVIEESLDVMLWALQRNDPENWISPNTRDEMLSLIGELDGPFKHHLDNYKYATRYAENEDVETFRIQNRQSALDILSRQEQRLRQNRYLLGSKATLLDYATFPFVRQFANTDRDWFDQQDIPHLKTWLTGLTSSQLFMNCMEKYDPWQSGTKGIPFPFSA